MGEWINKLWHIHMLEYYTAIKKELLIVSTTWMTLKCIILSEKASPKTFTYYI